MERGLEHRKYGVRVCVYVPVVIKKLENLGPRYRITRKLTSKTNFIHFQTQGPARVTVPPHTRAFP